MTLEFSTQRGVTRVVFGKGTVAKISAEIEAFGASRAIVVCTAGRKADATAIAARIGARSAGVLAIAREHVPQDTVAEARGELERSGADAVVAFGGGSAIGLAKALALHSKVRVVAIPTTYSGSEMTSMYGITEGGVKKTGRDDRVRAALVIYDPDLTAKLPRDVTVTSGWNAMAHAAEALWTNASDPATRLCAEEALRLLARSLRRLAVQLDDAGARTAALEGAYLAGVAFSDAGAGLQHRLCHVLGGMFALPHAATHAVLLPHVARSMAAGAPDAVATIARAIGGSFENLALETGAPRSLESLGMPKDGIDRVTLSGVDNAVVRAILVEAFAPATKAVAPALRGPTEIDGQPGFGSTHDSEALPGALPQTQNAPRVCPYGLHPELLSGTPFTTRNAQNSRMWMYRIRAAFSHEPLRPLVVPNFLAPLGDVDPNRMRWRPLPIPEAPARVDFIDGMVTLGGAGEPTSGPGYAVHLYAANADMADRSFSSADGDLLIVPQRGTLECRTELGWLRAAPGSILLVPRGMKFSIGVPEHGARGWMTEVYGARFRLPERGPIGSNGLADARHFRAPIAAYEDRRCPSGFEIVHKLGGHLYSATQEHSPFDVVAWHGNHVPCTYDLMLFNAMGSVTFDHPDPSIHTVLTAPLDDHGRAICDFVVFRGRWDVLEHSFRPPFAHRNAASEINGVVRVASVESGYEPGCTFVSPVLTSHGVATSTYDAVLDMPEERAEGPRRLSDDSLWIMFESALPFRGTAWSRQTDLVDAQFLDQFKGMRSRFTPDKI